MNEYDIVVLRKDIPDSNIKKGMKGTIVMLYNEPNLPIGFEVEFVDKEGKTIALVTLLEDDIDKIDD